MIVPNLRSIAPDVDKQSGDAACNPSQ